LSTLAFDYPDTPNRAARTQLFRNQLADYLLWCRDTKTDVFSVLGSYAGAVGIPQFMPTSLREYAVDYDGDGHVDLRNSPTDAIGSVGRFLQLHGWEANRPVAWRIASDAGSLGVAAAAADGEPWPTRTLNQLTRAGLRVDEPIDTAREGETGVLWWTCRRQTSPSDTSQPAQLLCADALQPQLLLRAGGVPAGRGGVKAAMG
jgi:membrane-bound lytic murein transglycosylase B